MKKKKIGENLKKRVFNTFRCPNHDIYKFIYCFKKFFTHMNTGLVGKNSVKHHYLTKKIFTVI